MSHENQADAELVIKNDLLNGQINELQAMLNLILKVI